MSIFLKSYVIFWSLWFVLVQTVGRFYSLHAIALAFDAIGLLIIWKFAIKQKDKDSSFHLGDLFKRMPKILKWSSVALFSGLLFTAVFQLPLDWDGMDYHLPPIIEAWQKDLWTRPENPYFAAKNYPKTGSTPALWWFEHFGGLLGLRLSLLIPLFHFVAGLFASLLIIGRSWWVLLFWIATPLVSREAVSYYSDLPALTSALCFFYFLKKNSIFLAALSLALHSSIKFTGILSGFFILFFTFAWLYFINKQKKIFRKALPIGFAMLLFVLVQPLENLLKEGRPFGPLQCRIMGVDFCGGSINPPDLIVAPVTPAFQKEDSFMKKIITGWTPSQIVPSSDVPTGGFGLAFIPAMLMFLFTLRKRADFQAGVLLVLLITELLIPGLWYARYHMALGWVFSMCAALYLQRSDSSKNIAKVTTAMLVIQMLWLVPQRNWFLGILQGENKMKILAENIVNIARNGVYLHATHPADKRHVDLYGVKNSTVHVCGDQLRPVLSAYGSTLTNEVKWYMPHLKPCPQFVRNPDLTIDYTEIWIEPKKIN